MDNTYVDIHYINTDTHDEIFVMRQVLLNRIEFNRCLIIIFYKSRKNNTIIQYHSLLRLRHQLVID